MRWNQVLAGLAGEQTSGSRSKINCHLDLHVFGVGDIDDLQLSHTGFGQPSHTGFGQRWFDECRCAINRDQRDPATAPEQSDSRA